jgi:hypothetical protein
MWLLMIVFLTVHTEQVLETFETQQACLIERDRILPDMLASYPEEYVERTFDIVCQFATKTI